MTNKQVAHRYVIWRSLCACLLVVLLLVIYQLLTPSRGIAVTQSGFINVTATVNGPPPSTASTIDSPAPGTVFSTLPILIKGTCPAQGLVIKIIDNGTFVGSTICQSSNDFSINIDLYKGQNVLVAQEFDSLDQQGPDSTTVSVTYNPPTVAPVPTTTSISSPVTSQAVIPQLVVGLNGQYNGYSGCAPGQQFSLPLKVSGGVSPYAVHIDWGDGTSSLVSLKDSTEPLVAIHAFAKAGSYQVTVTASDSDGQQALFSVAVVINGKPQSAITQAKQTVQRVIGWSWYYLLIGIFLLACGFGIGRRSHKKTEKPVQKPQS